MFLTTNDFLKIPLAHFVSYNHRITYLTIRLILKFLSLMLPPILTQTLQRQYSERQKTCQEEENRVLGAVSVFWGSAVYIVFVCFRLCWVFVAAPRFASSSCNRRGLLSSCGAQASRCGSFSRCSGSRARAQKLGHTGLAASGGSSQPRDGTHVSCTGRWIL